MEKIRWSGLVVPSILLLGSLLLLSTKIGAEGPRAGEMAFMFVSSTVIVGLLVGGLVALNVGKALRFQVRLQEEHPDGVIVDTYWLTPTLDRFLRPGTLGRHVPLHGCTIMVIATSEGIELARPRRVPVHFGVIPWEKIRAVRMETYRAPLGSRPLLVIELDGEDTLYADRIELMPSLKENRTRGSQLTSTILAKRPGSTIPAQ